MSKQGITWEDPPPMAKRGKGIWAERLAPLMKRKGKWGKLDGEWARTTVYNLKNNEWIIPDGRWEFAHRRPVGSRGRGVIYARFLGADNSGNGKP